MKEPYVIFIRYDRGEAYTILWVGYNINAGKVRYNHEVVDFFSYGPDDVTQLWFCQLKDLTDEQAEMLQSCVGKSDCDFNAEQRELITKQLFNDHWGWDRSIYHKEDIFCYNGTDPWDIAVSMGMDEEDIENMSDEEWNNFIKKYVVPFKFK